MTLQIIRTPRADREIRAIDFWWRENRPKNPDLFTEELASAMALMACFPNAGTPVQLRRSQGVRRFLLSATRFQVYYMFDAEKQQIAVVTVWSAVGKRGPRL